MACGGALSQGCETLGVLFGFESGLAIEMLDNEEVGAGG